MRVCVDSEDDKPNKTANSRPKEHRHKNGFDDSAEQFTVILEKEVIEFFARYWCALCRWLCSGGSAAIVWRVVRGLFFVVGGGGCRCVFISQ